MTSSTKFAIFGPTSSIGSSMIKFLVQKGHAVNPIERGKWPARGSHLGNIIYTIGVTGSFRENPFSTVSAHVSLLEKALEHYRFDSFTYLSSVRVYSNGGGSDEESGLVVNPTNLDDIYNITKLCGEAACFAFNANDVKVVRLSNVIGGRQKSQSFLPQIFKQMKNKGSVVFTGSKYTEKDYISENDALIGIYLIATKGIHRIYNLASGINTSNMQIADLLNQLGFETVFRSSATVSSTFIVDNKRFKSEFSMDFQDFNSAFIEKSSSYMKSDI